MARQIKDGDVVIVGTGLPLVAASLAKNSHAPNVILLLESGIFDGNLIYPKVVGESTGLHPLFVLLAVTVGGGISGLYGMVLAVPVAGVLKILFNKWVSRKTSIADNA